MFFFFNDVGTTEMYTYGHPLSRHDVLPILGDRAARGGTPRPRHGHVLAGARRRPGGGVGAVSDPEDRAAAAADPVVRYRRTVEGGDHRDLRDRKDRKSTRLNSSH